MSIREQHEFTLALLRAAGLSTEHVVSVRYEHDTTSLPVMTVTYYTFDNNESELVSMRFVPEAAS